MTGYRQEMEGRGDKDAAEEDRLNDYMRQLLSEKAVIDEKKCPFAYRFIDEGILCHNNIEPDKFLHYPHISEIGRIQQKLVTGPPRDTRYIDVYHERPVKISVKVLVPIKEHPRVCIYFLMQDMSGAVGLYDHTDSIFFSLTLSENY